MTDPRVSPISQLLHTLGITREDLMKRSDQMRQFLTADDAMSSRVFDRDISSRPRSGSDLQSNARSVSSTRSLARSLSRASSSSLRDYTPPSTPVKTEPHETLLPPHRRMDSMEMVIERQRRQRKSRKERERETSKNRRHPTSPSPSNASQSGSCHNSMVQFRDESRANSLARSSAFQNAPEESVMVEPPPVTPQKNKYYREHTNMSTHLQQLNDGTSKSQTPTPTRAAPQTVPQGQALPQFYAHPAYMGYPHYLPMAYRALQASSSAIPVTPQAQRIQTVPPGFPPSMPIFSPLPSSSPPPPASSPASSPVRRVVNLVSSPGPMGPDPRDDEYDNLPYKLPPGPYLTTKPDLSYAALIGRAILSSPEHRLTLQEIYDWITIVYPYYKRGETTWMNSIRHVLSTTVVFRKVPRDRSVGRTLWAIYDEDLQCFKDGGFKKQFCKDYVNGSDNRDKGKGKARKRADDDDGDRKAKKPRKEQIAFGSSGDSAVVHSSFLAWNNLGHPFFPPRPTTHLQPYYQDMPQPTFPTIPAEIIFPPLPPSAALNRIMSGSGVSVSVSPTDDSGASENIASSPPTTLRSSPVPPSISSATSSSSVPELTPHRNSSSPSSSMPATSDLDVDMHAAPQPGGNDGLYPSICPAIMANLQEEESSESPSSVDVDADAIFNTSLLGPVKFWRDPPKASDALQPGLDILGFIDNSDHENSSQNAIENVRSRKGSALTPIPISPTLNVRAIQSKSDGSCRPTTPLLIVPPSTPPRSTHKISSIRTPISHKGLNMSPSASLAHYKSNLDPPPAVSGGVAPLAVSQGQSSTATAAAAEDETVDPHRTPRKRANVTTAPSIFGTPITPKKLIFSDSPFRTPLDSSPFRTPRRMFDPHDPRTMLDDELNRMNAYDDSPAGLYGKERLLYDSPGFEGYKYW